MQPERTISYKINSQSMKPEDFDAMEKAYRLKLVTFPKAVEAYKIWAAVTVSPDPEFIRRIESRLEGQNYTKEQTQKFIDLAQTNSSRLLGLPESTDLDVFEILSSTVKASLIPNEETILHRSKIVSQALETLDENTAEAFLGNLQRISTLFSETVAH